LENVIGGLTLFADRPARVGEYCQIGNQTGTIEEIGLRTTKIRRKDDTLVTIANAELAQARIENFSRRRKYSFDLVLRLHYQTTMAQFQEIAAGIRALLQEHEKVAENTERVTLRGLGDYAIELEVHALIDDPPNAPGIVEELNLSILDVIRGAGAALAYPSHTSYVASNDAPPEPKQTATVLSQAQTLPKLASD
jgi:MscS family membrane protein